MAKRPTLTDITAAFASASKVNANFDAIEVAFDNTVSRDGSSPNQMLADFDLNSNDLLNVGSINGSTDFSGAINRGVIEEYVPFTRAEVLTRTFDSSVDAIRTAGHTTVGDGGGALYGRVGAEPSHAFKVQSADGAWWEGVPESGGVFPEQVGATADGTTDDSTVFANALAVTGVVLLRDASYRLSSQFLIENSGKAITGLGKDKSKLIVGDGLGNAGIRFNNALHCTMRDLTIQSNDDTGAGVELDETSGNSISNVFLNVRFIGNSGGGRPAITKTAHVAVRGHEAASGQSNYFHRFIGCDFDSWYAAFHADYNANAWFVSDCKFQNVWRCFKGGFQEWMCNTLFWHSSAGSGTDKAFFLEGIGKSASQKMIYNVFLNVDAEPGATLTEMWSMDANTNANTIYSMYQTAARGTDNGTHNQLHGLGGIREAYLSDWKWLHSGDVLFGGAGNAGEVMFYGNGSNSDTGTARKVYVYGGSTSETRHGRIYQTPGGDFNVEGREAGALRLSAVSGIQGQGRSGAGGPTTSQVPDGYFVLWKDTLGGSVNLYYNDGGTLVSVALT